MTREEAQAKQRKLRESKREFVLQYLLLNPCIDCGEKDPIVLEFDHRGDKVRAISLMTSGNLSLRKIVEEIEKCEVRCANCHRRKTARQMRSYKWKRTQADGQNPKPLGN